VTRIVLLLLVVAIAGCQKPDKLAAKQVEQSDETIPTAFQGLWLADQKACRGGNWNEGYSIGPDSIRMGKSGAPIKVASISLVTPTDIIISTSDPDAGWSFNGKFRFILDRTGKVLSNAYDDRTASFDYQKCEAS